MTLRDRFSALHETLTGEKARERQRAIEDMQIAQHNRQTQAQHAAFKRARRATNDLLRMGK